VLEGSILAAANLTASPLEQPIVDRPELMSKQRSAVNQTESMGEETGREGETNLRQVRTSLRRITRDLVNLCQARANLLGELSDAQQVAELLRQETERVREDTGIGPLTADNLQAVFRELDAATRALVRVERIAFLGPEFSYSHLAAITRFGQAGDLVPVSTIGGVFEAVDRGDVDFGMVPIENSTDGRIVDTLEMFVRLPVKICGEVPMRIHHNLLGKGKLSQVREVHSKPQALSQCRNWLARNLPKARLVAASSTTAAAESAASDAQIAAVASRQAGVNYGLSPLAENIEDNPDNITRFAIIGLHIQPRSGRDKTSLMFELSHEPGALADAMAVFKRNRLNLTWIESFPKKGSKNEYLFFVELEGHANEAAVKRAIRSLEKKTVRIEILGAYARSEISE
jgi:chorismate mutase/prephenate dehydratase